MTVFGAEYAGAYDALYHEKDYAEECDLVERVLHDYGHGPVRRVLDLGCGTGRHTAELAARGYDVVGVDRSAEMLRNAHKTARAQFVESDITQLRLEKKFDAVLIMFAVLGYLTDNTQIDKALRVAREHLHAGGLLFADIWYGPAVLAQRPSQRVKVIDTRQGDRIIRVASSQLDVRRNVCAVDYQLWRLRGDRVCAEVREGHTMRYFFEPELEAFLSGTGFDLQRIGAFPNFYDDPGEHTWNIAFAARAR